MSMVESFSLGWSWLRIKRIVIHWNFLKLDGLTHRFFLLSSLPYFYIANQSVLPELSTIQLFGCLWVLGYRSSLFFFMEQLEVSDHQRKVYWFCRIWFCNILCPAMDHHHKFINDTFVSRTTNFWVIETVALELLEFRRKWVIYQGWLNKSAIYHLWKIIVEKTHVQSKWTLSIS